MKNLLCCLLLAAPLCAQRDFLNADEIDRIKEAQDPVERLKLYAQFAKQRADLVQSLSSKDKAGRSILMHDALEDYSKILDAIDDVTDDALLRKFDVKPGLSAVAATERQTLPMLRKLRDSQPKDISRYDFALKQAIETAEDSLQASEEDLGERARDVEAREAREKKEIKDLGGPAAGNAKAGDKSASSSSSDDQQPPKRKPPTLKRPGEQ